MTPKDRVYVITDRKTAGDKFFEVLERLIENGFTFIQLREKDLSAIELYKLGVEVKKLAGKKRLKLFINDRVDVAMALNAEGVQLTEMSLTPDIVRTIGSNLKIGLSVHDVARLKRFEKYADFFVFGNIFETKSKPGVTGRGLFALKQMVQLTSKPVYAVGGVDGNNMELAFEAGAYGVAMKGVFFSSENFLNDIKNIKQKLKGGR